MRCGPLSYPGPELNPGAYKNLESVIEAQTDLVEVVARLTTLLCVKG